MDYTNLQNNLDTAKSLAELYYAIVNVPFEHRLQTAELFLGIIVLLVVNEETGMIDRVALSKTELAENTTTVSAKPFHDIKIPLNHSDNSIARAISSGEPQETTDWNDLFTPALSAEESRLNQASGGIAYSAIYPLPGYKKGAAMIFSHYQYMHEIGDQQHVFMRAYSKICAEKLASFKQK